AHIAAGHALQLAPAPDLPAANAHYLQAMALADTFGVPRTKVEAYMGLALLHGFGGDLGAAEAAAREGLAIVERSGDAWTAAWLWTALGAVGAAAGAGAAPTWLAEAETRYRVSHDTYGQAVVQLWLAVWHGRAGRTDALARHTRALLALVGRYGYDGLLTATTLFGPRDRMMLVPLLLAGRADPATHAPAGALLARGFPAIAADEGTQTYHPGTTLRIRMLGRLQVWRGAVPVEPREWQRKKAQQMLGFLLTNRGRWLLREQICDALWPDEDADNAEAQFKVTLNGLNSVLEPARPPRTAPFYIRREGTAYRFYPSTGVWLDVEIFETRIEAARMHRAAGSEAGLDAAQEALSTALDLYQGEYLSDWLYEEWTQEERARLALRYLEAATTLANLLLDRDQPGEAIRVCELILERDPAWEDAYAILMRAYTRQEI
ncbi:MAG TPA: BTAD domain-containing putative transcriptional regulator, partial [Myxococcota bacterium]|nr:BTAD domain-containing putative transcriptional regulator [Myxococcota bacterium]